MNVTLLYVYFNVGYFGFCYKFLATLNQVSLINLIKILCVFFLCDIYIQLIKYSYVKPCNVEFKDKAWLLSAWMHSMTRVFALRICQFVGFAIPWCIQCICYQTRAKLSKDGSVKVRVDQ